MDWDLCKTFVAVADTGSFTAAARRLHTSHPTVSRKIAALEAQLGTRLVARAADGLALTADGRTLREHAEAMAAAALRAETAVAAGGHKARGIVKLSIGATLASHWLMPRLPAFLRAHDHIQLEIITHPFPASVRRREADVVLRPFDTGEENLVGRKIGRLGTGFYASRDYAAGRSLPERRGDWKEHSVIGFADQTSNAQLARWSDVVTRQARVAMRCSSQGDMLAAVRAGIGISALSCFVAEAYSDLVRVAPQKLASVADLWLLAHPDLVELPAVRAVIEFVAECARTDRARLRG
ncbi:LysR family transcriptional regulator [Bradyrhizobium yuanmingense]|uniref:LysR family transcriptional regulator n=1 Tax=Bradyrhizobium yuanmingense TaxID=108015 RepID=A0A0R3C9S5_9BRAD|nr:MULTISPECIES: LysR family transcriptional regulator [Bradyrhizobium]KRP94432.1 LysR family transcriptional regulator [Bradyrhizobium yuanmingense]MCA1377258.1 LysR family transcriptional regulator [Bradyrhizobium sp. IC4060]MCA1431594.1 LysR family transcriptional regulator [Bradyrhizobium sp. BRP20]MCA1469385.1 LysR family transcriptional regulator [Bradyrhizobium sp. IC3195]MCA1486406.1 LysR family transcriptional regulator [Bradyrhizobium sp. IC4061]